MKHNSGISVVISCLILASHYVYSNNGKKLYPLQCYLPIKISGYVQHESFWDSRQVVGFREDHYLLYPEKKVFDAQCQDINARGQFNMVAIQTRLRVDADGPQIGGAQSAATIEADFFGRGISNSVRMRHAFLKLDWDHLHLLAGQYWHPVYIPGADPRVHSFNGGAPIEIYSRAPQLRFTYKFSKQIDVLFAASSELDSPSDGPLGADTSYLRNAIIPMLDLHLQTHVNNHLFGIGVNYKRIVPRLQTNTGIAAHESLNSICAIAYGSLTWEKISTRTKLIFAQNAFDQNMIGGYAVHCVDPIDDHRDYTNINVVSWWNDTEIEYRRSLLPGFFIGIVKNLGARTTILQNVTDQDGTVTDKRIYGQGTDIDYVFRCAPRISWKSHNFTFGAELEYTRAAYGTITNDADVIDTTPVGNVRLLLALYYFI